MTVRVNSLDTIKVNRLPNHRADNDKLCSNTPNVQRQDHPRIPVQNVLVQNNIKFGAGMYLDLEKFTLTDKEKIDSIVRPNFTLSTVYSDTLSFENAADIILENDGKIIDYHFFGDTSGEHKYSKLGYALVPYKNENPAYYQELLSTFNQKNIRNVAMMYEDFYNSTLKDLGDVSKGNKKYSKYWIENATLGDKKIADIRLNSMGYDEKSIRNMPVSEKTKKINENLKNKDATDKAAAATVDFWLKNLHTDNSEGTETTRQALVQKFDETIPKTEADVVMSKIKSFKRTAQNRFNDLIPQNPLAKDYTMSFDELDKYDFVFSLVFDGINHAEGGFAVSTLEALHEFTKATNKKKQGELSEPDAAEAWENLVEKARMHWNKTHLPAVLDAQIAENIEMHESLKELQASGRPYCEHISDIVKSDEYSNTQKIFLVKKSMSNEGYDFKRFVTQDKPNAYLRKILVNNLMEAETNAEQGLIGFNEEFIHAIRNGETNNPILNIQVDGQKLIHFYHDKISGAKNPPRTSVQEQLNSLTDTELMLLAEDFKPYFLNMVSQTAFERESTKYDFAIGLEQQLDDKFNTLGIAIGNNTLSLHQALTTHFDEVKNHLLEVDSKVDKQSRHLLGIENEMADQRLLLEDGFDAMGQSLGIINQTVNNVGGAVVLSHQDIRNRLLELDKTQAALAVIANRYPQRRLEVDAAGKAIKQKQARLEAQKRRVSVGTRSGGAIGAIGGGLKGAVEGAAAGSVFGPVGTAVGAILGAAVGAAGGHIAGRWLGWGQALLRNRYENKYYKENGGKNVKLNK